MGAGASRHRSGPAGLGPAAVKDFSYKEEVTDAARAATGQVFSDDLSSRVEISVSCKELKRRGRYKCVLSAKRAVEPNWLAIGETETSIETSNPRFVSTVTVDFSFEVQQKVKVELLLTSGDTGLTDLSVGAVECYLAEIVASKDKVLLRPMLNASTGKTIGTIVLVGEEMKKLKHQISFDLRAVKLQNRSFFAKRNPFAIIYRTLDFTASKTGSPNPPIHRTEVVRKTSEPRFTRVTLSVQALCRGESDRLVKIELWDYYDGLVNPQVFAFATTTLEELEAASLSHAPVELELRTLEFPGKRRAGMKKHELGILVIENIEIEKRTSFLDYVEGGLEMNLLIAVDFTKSNKDPTLPESLHYMHPDQPSDYVMAIRAVGEILQHYDSDKKYPLYGFGAKLPPSFNHCSHCFAANGNYFSPDVQGIDGVVAAYRKALQATVLHGPTNFHEIVKLAGDWAEPYAHVTEDLKYFVLLILTDGVINDMQLTINQIVRASRFPMSVIIVGVGNEDFALMDNLDADDEPLWSTEEKKFMERDIVQFVPFNEFKNLSYHELALATLDEIPREVVNFFKSRNIKPSEPRLALHQSAPDTPRAAAADAATPMPKFLDSARRKLLAAAIGKGMHKEDVDVILHEGLPCPDLNYLIDVAQNSKRGVEGGPMEAYLKGPHTHKAGVRTATVKMEFGGSVRELAAGSWAPEVHSSANGTAEHSEAEIDAPPKETEDMVKRKSEGRRRSRKDKTGDNLDRLCKICFERPIDMVVVPCGHLVVCSQCADTVKDLCPMCRQAVTSVVKTYHT